MDRYPAQLEHGSGVLLTLDPTRALLAFREKVSREDVQRRLAPLNLVLETGDAETGKPDGHIINQTDDRLWVRSATNQPIDLDRLEESHKELPALAWVGPVYRSPELRGPGAYVCPLPRVLLVRPREGGPHPEVSAARLWESLGLEEAPEQSKYLNGFLYFNVTGETANAYQVKAELLDKYAQIVQDVRYENMPMEVPVTVVPDDPLFGLQWNMTQIDAPAGWNATTGEGATICILDRGVDIGHPDLKANIVPGGGINIGTMVAPGTPFPPGSGHGTCCAGIAAAVFNNHQGVTGVAGNCQIMPIAFQYWTDVEIAKGITYAAENGAQVISMSFGKYAPGEGYGPIGWDFAVINPAIEHAVNDLDRVLCAATGNENTGTVNRYPARHPLVIAVGASDRTDHRKSPASPDGECWGANFGPGISVAAPGVQIPTTDIRGTGGYNVNGGPITVACVTYPSAGDAAGDYFYEFDGTSAATPHVAGLATLIRSLYPALNHDQVRQVIERTAAKVGGVYLEQPGYPNGTRNAELGYGRIEVAHALDFADVMIRDWPGDTGVEPSIPPGGDFWDYADIVVRPQDDGVFLPADVTQSSRVIRGQTNYLYVRVVNHGPAPARNVTVDVRITPWVGLQFVYPGDWTTIDPNHVRPTPIKANVGTLAVNASAIAKFKLSAKQVDALWNWNANMIGHPCLLAMVHADNDYAFAQAPQGSGEQTLLNNLAQRNLAVIPALAGAVVTFPFLIGSAFARDRIAELVVEHEGLPSGASALIALQPPQQALARSLPSLDGFATADSFAPSLDGVSAEPDQDIVFRSRSSVELPLGAMRGVLTLEPGSRLHLERHDAVIARSVQGGQIVLKGDQRYFEIREATASLTLEKPVGAIPMLLIVTVPEGLKSGQRFSIRLRQRNERGLVLGGATVTYVAEPARVALPLEQAPTGELVGIG